MALPLLSLRTLFKRTFRQPIQQPSLSLATRLPPELLSLIVSYITERRDLHSLCLTCRILYYTSRTALYKTINTRTSARRSQGKRWVTGAVVLNEAGHEKLYRTIETRGFCAFITDFRISRVPCNNQLTSTWFRSKCTCDRFDAMLGQVLFSLVRLRILHFVCCSCWSPRDRHQYLKELRTKQLEVLLFRCGCSSRYASNLVGILDTACMSSIRSLYLPYTARPSNLNRLAAKECLPHLNKIMCESISLLPLLCSKGTISHLGYRPSTFRARDGDGLHEILRQSPRRLSYLYLRQDSHRVPRFIQTDVTPYLSLRHFGRLFFWSHNISCGQISESISSLTYLPQLFSIHIWIQPPSGPMGDNEVSKYISDFIKQMTEMLAIQKIYVTIPFQTCRDSIWYDCWIWELQEGQWNIQKLGNYTPWNIMNEECA